MGTETSRSEADRQGEVEGSQLPTAEATQLPRGNGVSGEQSSAEPVVAAKLGPSCAVNSKLC